MDQVVSFELHLGSLEVAKNAFENIRVGSEIEFCLPHIFKAALKYAGTDWAEIELAIDNNSGKAKIIRFATLPPVDCPKLQETLPELLR